jgi:hypothetical protein
MSWLTDEEKLLCHMVLDDSLGPQVSDIAEGAFFRAFIVQNRKTGLISAKMRWSYKKPKGKSWVELKPTDQNQNDPYMTVEYLRCGIENVLKTALTAFGINPQKVANAVHCYYPPDDGGDASKTIIWLEERDLIEIERVDIEYDTDIPKQINDAMEKWNGTTSRRKPEKPDGVH